MDDQFIQKTVNLRGEKEGKKWLESIPFLIKEFEAKWQIKVSDPFKLYVSYVAPGVSKDGQEVVLKIYYMKNI